MATSTPTTSKFQQAKEFEVETFSGQFVDVNDPRPSSIKLEDIAHALSQTCRYGGHCRRFYSVAEHAVFVSHRIARRGHGVLRQLAGLHHDDAEAYLGDIPRPLKPLLTDFSALEDRMDRAIVAALDLPFTTRAFHDAEVKTADNWSLFVEAKFLLPSQGEGWGDGEQGAFRWDLELPGRIVVPDYWLAGVPPEAAERLFLERHAELTEGELS